MIRSRRYAEMPLSASAYTDTDFTAAGICVLGGDGDDDVVVEEVVEEEVVVEEVVVMVVVVEEQEDEDEAMSEGESAGAGAEFTFD
jgi:hypothetical protein